jgi:hypothetical protein
MVEKLTKHVDLMQSLAESYALMTRKEKKEKLLEPVSDCESPASPVVNVPKAAFSKILNVN